MKRRAIKSFFAAAVFLLLAGSAEAASQVYFSIQYHDNATSKTNIVLNRAFNLPNAGDITLVDDTGASRTVNAQSVLAVLSDIQNTTNAYSVTDLKYYPSFSSLYLRCMQLSVASSACDNWQYWINGVTDAEYGPDGMDQHVLNGGETIYVYFGDYGTYPTAVDKNIFALFSPGPIGGSVQGPASPVVLAPAPAAPQFNVEKAIAFLAKNQNADGSVGTAPLFSDWAAVAFGAYENDNPAKTKLKSYLLTDTDSGTLLTDYERRAMALMALGINPYGGTQTNYIQKILNGFDGTQFGDQNLINDDIFALLVLTFAGYRNIDYPLTKEIPFLLKNQNINGSFGNVDITAAAVQALSQVAVTNDVKDALNNARQFLSAHQDNSGAFGNVYSTAWATQAFSALGEYAKQDFLQSQQAPDGGVLSSDTVDNRVWATSYAIPAALRKDWGAILAYFEKPAVLAPSSMPLPIPVPQIAQSEDQQIPALQQQIVDLSLQIEVLQRQIADAKTLNVIGQQVAEIAVKTSGVKTQVAELLRPAEPKTFAFSELPLSASVAQNTSAFPRGTVALALVASAVFLLFAAWNIIRSWSIVDRIMLVLNSKKS